MDKTPLQVGATSVEFTGLVSRSTIKLFNGRESWELKIGLEFADSQNPKTAAYCVGNPNWKATRRQEYMVSANALADWLSIVLDDSMTLIAATRPACPQSGIVKFIKKFGTTDRKKTVHKAAAPAQPAVSPVEEPKVSHEPQLLEAA